MAEQTQFEKWLLKHTCNVNAQGEPVGCKEYAEGGRRLTILLGLLVFTIIGSGILALINYTAPGIVAIEGYSHAVAICEFKDGRNHEMEQVKDVMYTWVDQGVMYTVNWDHLDDQEVKQLEVKADSECAQFFDNLSPIQALLR